MKNKILNKPEINMIIGMEEIDAIKHLKYYNYTMRIVNRDNRPLMTTNDVDEKRVNVFITDGIISDIHNIG